MLENYNINEKEINKSQLIVKLIKRKILCLMALKQYKKAQTYWKNMLQLSKNDPKCLEGTNCVANILYYIINQNNLFRRICQKMQNFIRS